MKVFVCRTCTEDGTFVDVLRAGLQGVEVESADCMSGCTRPQTVAFREANKVAYLFGDITENDLPDLQNFAKLYAASPDGSFVDARVLGALRTKAIARIPG
jgi:predicted metal-binding protein